MAATPSPTPPPSDNFCGLIEVNIIEVAELPPRKDKSELKPYVIAYLKSKPSAKQETQPAKAPFRWGVMLSFPTFDAQDTLILDVKDYFMLSSDVPRGTCTIPLSNIILNQISDMWLPLNTSSEKKAILGGRLHIELAMKLANPDEIAATPKSKRKSVLLAMSSSSSNLMVVGNFKVDDIGEIAVLAPDAFPITSNPKGPMPFSYNPATGMYEVPTHNLGGFWVLDKDTKEL